MADSEQRFAQQLKKGVLEMLVLRLLADAPSHGYQLIVRLRESSGGMLELKEGTLYPILYRLEEEGCIASAWNRPDKQLSSGKVPRRVYSVTETGRTVLEQETAAWHRFVDCVEQYVGRDPQ
ncbi:PadR family transcriptional regulator [Subdoligranulum variabile]|uniref:Transcriptional regulator, PadR family n=1 Tax=Subdoligranulum variabile DSM 15176 TaxID=411471 RepID=D1PN95_9FIRM|nr:helix-turn-helix transcriptional regulator [Subdoligranulum variabile]EFB76030.1 transcriptional regulator, PadR family [Subdoligranulum variabile DSM 15176]UWP68683.1 helix-turn-helix transcriptional regulator [Subdoligranulum variabile]